MSERKKLKGAISIGRPSYGDGKELITIQVRDDLSRTRFADIEIGLADFVKALTGLAEVPIVMQVRGLDNVGKIKETKSLVFQVHDADQAAAEKLAAEFCDEGWLPSLYFNSQKSFTHDRVDGQAVIHARTQQYRYVEEDGS